MAGEVEITDDMNILSFPKLRRSDSLDIESNNLDGHRGNRAAVGWWVTLQLAFQSIGIVYGDIGTSPLYVFQSSFPAGIKHKDDVLGVLSLIYYTLTLIPLVKYVFIVLQANDNGDGLIPNQQAEDKEVSNYQLDIPNNRVRRASWLKSQLENRRFAKLFLLFATMLGTSMVIGDGVLTPCISVLSAVGGIKTALSSITQDTIVGISAGILVCLFMAQRFGTDKVGYTFAPIICIWFIFIASIGFYNFVNYDPSVISALNPKYIIDYFRRNKTQAWISLGGIVLSITGTEALFADVGHFSVRSIQISMCIVTYPALLLSYTGQASYLRIHIDDVGDAFFKSIPDPLYYPMFVVAVLSAIIASQAMISGTFSIIQQSLSLGCFPRVKIVHTSSKYEGQVYIPQVNFLLMLASLAVTLAFKDTNKIGNAYGIAVVFVMTLTSSFLVLIMIMIWKTHILLIIIYILVIGSLELLYLSSVLYKFDQGGYLPLAFAFALMAIMYTWNTVYRRKYYYELHNKISSHQLNDIVSIANPCRVQGLAIFYSDLVQGIPPIFKLYMSNVPVLHQALVFVSIKSLPISKVPSDERFLFRRVEPRELGIFRCVVRYGYTDGHNDVQESFERSLVDKLKGFLRDDVRVSTAKVEEEEDRENGVIIEEEKQKIREVELEKEIEEVDKAWEYGVVHLVGESEIIAKEGSNIWKRVLINYIYNFLKNNLRQSERVFDIPHNRLLKVGMTYEL
ncbi:potassium transporter 5 isoform X2 [Cucumis sativus]|uniref:potassium transporter 5 isoform X2 n=1 Tax=Cucumis sativus TaxID=3659 RepID=UPI0012F526DF|nr:potassium transporter 5 isoform X2 [Cucumis sativus]